jgi:hypothetical protein
MGYVSIFSLCGRAYDHESLRGSNRFSAPIRQTFFHDEVGAGHEVGKIRVSKFELFFAPLDIAAQDMLCALCAQYSPLSCGFAAPG